MAKEVTGEKDNATAAITRFRKILNNESMIYFNKEPIPDIESNTTAHTRCSDIKGAKKYCPNRWDAYQLWMAESRKAGFVVIVLHSYNLFRPMNLEMRNLPTRP